MNIFATTDQLLQYLDQVNGTAPSEVALAQVALDRAASILEGALQPVTFAAWPATATAAWVISTGGEYIKLPPHQIGTVTAMSYLGTTVDPTTYIETTEGNIRINPALLTYSSVWHERGDTSWVRGNFSITAKWGYGPPPLSMTELCLELAVNIRKQKDNGMFQQVLGADDGAALRYVGGLNSTQRAMIQNVKAKYLRPVF